MTIKRANLLTDAGAREKYVRGVKLLKAEFTGPTTTSLGIAGPTQQVSTYDLFVVWHHAAMSTPTPSTQGDRNAAHRGPVFCPWHRFMLRQLELNLQRVLSDINFGLPYWDWASDGQKTPAQQKLSQLWAASAMGGSGSPVMTGPFGFQANGPAAFRVRIEADVNGRLVQTNHGLRRTLGAQIARLPNKADVAGVVSLTPYDALPWSTSSAGFRNRLEGWALPAPPALHNRVHVWVGGDMLPSTSPNDPVFFMHHCNVDRIWEAWLTRNGRSYLPAQTAPSSLKGHRINDLMASLLSAPMKPADVLDMTAVYAYDSLAV